MENSPLRKLAPELREKIWEYAVLMPSAIWFCYDGAAWHVGNQSWRLYSPPAAMHFSIPLHEFVASMTACKQMHSEMFGIFFAMNRFRVSKHTALQGPQCAAKLAELDEFLGPAASAAIQQLHIDGGSYDISMPRSFPVQDSLLHDLFLHNLRVLRPLQNQNSWRLCLTVTLGFDCEEKDGDNVDNEQIPNRSWANQVELAVPVDGSAAEMARMQRQFEEAVKGVQSSEEVAVVRRVIDRCMIGDYGTDRRSGRRDP